MKIPITFSHHTYSITFLNNKNLHKKVTLSSLKVKNIIELRTCNSSKLNSPYSLLVPFPFVKIPQPDIIVVPDLILVIVAGNSNLFGLCVVTPTSILPDHLSTNLSIRIWKMDRNYFSRIKIYTLITANYNVFILQEFYLKQFIIFERSMCHYDSVIKFV